MQQSVFDLQRLMDFIKDLSLQKPLAFFDLETTGTNFATDRIIQIAITRFNPTGSLTKYSTFVNPGIPLKPEILELTGITDSQLEFSPAFADVAHKIGDFLKNCDLAGHNIMHFDVPLLCEEMLRAGINFPETGCRMVDTMRIFEKIMPRSLDNAYKFFVGRDRTNQSHEAGADVDATVEVFQNQIERFASITGRTMDEWHKIASRDKIVIDFAGKITVDAEGYYIWTFGKNQNKRLKDDLNYCTWVLTADFTNDTKRWVQRSYKEGGKYAGN